MTNLESQEKKENIFKTYRYGVLDPRSIPDAEKRNAEVLGATTLGIEVSICHLASQCGLGNIDPQHQGDIKGEAAIESALEHALPPIGSQLVTIRLDLDSIGAMAIIALRAERAGINSLPSDLQLNIVKNIQRVACADKFAHGAWPGPRTLPSKTIPWPEDSERGGGRDLRIMGYAISDFKVPLEIRVGWMKDWLLAGVTPAGYEDRLERERTELIEALKKGTITITTCAEGRIALVESTHRAATMIGYSLAPVVIARNPRFSQGQIPPYVKYSIAQFTEGYVDLMALKDELSRLELGWGGGSNILGSPQGSSSVLSLSEVQIATTAHLKCNNKLPRILS